MGLSNQVLDFIDTHVDENSRTLETGSGLSTVTFAIRNSQHIAITPSQDEVDKITQYCREHDISTERLTFKVAPSEDVLPQLECEPLDLVLIDGRHGFPAPFIDWFYTAGKLKVGGLVIIDDILLWTCGALRDFLLQEPEWTMVSDFSPRSVVFKKTGHGSEWKEWTQQEFVLKHSLLGFDNSGELVDLTTAGRLRRAMGLLRKGGEHLRRGELLILAKKSFKKVRK
jgi:hypothetical protein